MDPKYTKAGIIWFFALLGASVFTIGANKGSISLIVTGVVFGIFAFVLKRLIN